MRNTLFFLGACGLFFGFIFNLRAEEKMAEKYYEEKSYAQAAVIWEKELAGEQPSPGSERERELTCKIADAQWRALASTSQQDQSIYQPSLKKLRSLTELDPPDRWSANAWESLGNQAMAGQRWWGLNSAEVQGDYLKALAFWGGSDASNEARQRYLGIVFSYLDQSDRNQLYYLYSTLWPLEIAENAVLLATTPLEVAKANFILAGALQRSNQVPSPALWKRIQGAFSAAVNAGKKTEWYDDALYAAGQWSEQQGRLEEPAPGQYQARPDYSAALKYYGILLSAYSKGESRWRDDAERRVEEITKPLVQVNLGSAFLPDAPVEFALNARNTGKVEMSIAKLDLVAALTVQNAKSFNRYERRSKIKEGIGEVVRSWTVETKGEGEHEIYSKMEKTDPLPSGIYWIEGKAGGSQSGAVLLVSKTTVNVQSFPGKLLLYTCDAMSGEPVPSAKVQVLRYLLQNSGDERRYHTQILSVETDKDGVATLPIPKPAEGFSHEGMAVVAMAGDQPAFLMDGVQDISRSDEEGTVIFVYTDRPAYRPEDKVQFKFIHRLREDGIYQTKPGREIRVDVTDPDGVKLLEKTYKINEFGSAADSFVVPKEGKLGTYQISFFDKTSKENLATKDLFRLEEYKLPEFKVSVKVPEKDGVPVIVRTGEKAKALVQVDYYSGGPVANAEVEYDLYQEPFRGDNPWPEPYPWLYQDFRSSASWMSFWNREGGRNLVKRDKTKTDAAGEARIEFETPPGTQGWKYTIEARVSDSSRREVQGSGSVKVTALPFNFYLRPQAQVIQPGDTARVDVKARNANDRPQSVQGTAVITREVWVERSRISKKTGKSVVTFRGYESKEFERRDIQTDAEGKLTLSFKPLETGYYKIQVLSPAVGGNSVNKNEAPVQRVIGETSLFVADAKTTDLGYRYGALQLFPDKQTYHVGDTARVVVVAPDSKCAALLTLEGEDLLDCQVVRMDGSVKLIEFKITEACEPNIFFNGFMVRNGQTLVATEEAVVPPEEHFLKVEVRPDGSPKKPGEKGTQTVRVTDSEGKPVKAELSLGVVDASIFYIQEDTAGDIRQAFFGEKRMSRSNMRSTLNELSMRGPVDEDEEETRREFLTTTGSSLSRNRLDDEKDGTLYAMEAPAGAWGFMKKEAFRRSAGEVDSPAAPSASPAAMDIAVAVDEPKTQVVVRSDFRATAFWEPDLITDEKGEAKIDLQYPDSLTEWKTTARALTVGSRFGSGEADVKTSQPVMCRLQTPRFVVERDQVTLSAVVSNQTDKEISVQVAIDAKNLKPLGKWESTGKIPAKGQKRFDRVFYVEQAGGIAEVTASAKSEAGGDAMKLSLPILEHGLEKFVARSAVLQAGTDREKMAWNLELPMGRNPGSAQLDFVLAPSLASTCLDALPYLADYPYGCVEQTMSRFLPAAIAAQVLQDMKLDPEAVAGRLFGGMEKGSAQSLKMKKGNLADLDKMVNKGVDRLRSMQHGDGGWGWWAEGDTNDFMTAYVVQGLALGEKAGIKNGGMKAEGANYLRSRLVKYENDPDMQAWLLYAIALSGVEWNKLCIKAADHSWEQREKLNAYTRSLLALAFQARISANPEYAERAKILVQNLENGVIEVKAESELIGAAGSATMPVTCHWGEDGVAYRWSDGGVEATAFALRAMLVIDPANKRIDQAARWLINNRRGAQWKNTKDTAIVVMSLLDYMKQTREISPKLTADLVVNGKIVKSLEFNAENALGTLSLSLPDEALKGGENRVELQVKGEGRLYASAYLKYFTKEEPITAEGSEIYVKREYYRETPVKKLLGGVRLEKTLLKDGEEVQSGDRIEVRLLLEAKNNYEFLLFEDKKPAGCEAVQVQSGTPMEARARLANGKFEGEATFVYQELRDVQVAFFITSLKAGQHEIRYMLRAETPGKFHALPALGQAMYVPEIRANSDEMRILIEDKGGE